MTTPSTPRRVATVSSATLLLCLFAAGTAVAATSPRSDGSLTGPLTSTVTSTVSGAVSTVSSAVPVPAATTTPAAVAVPAPAPTPTPTPTGLAGAVSTVTSTVTGVVASAVSQLPSVAPSLPAPAPVPSSTGTPLGDGGPVAPATRETPAVAHVSIHRHPGGTHTRALTQVVVPAVAAPHTGVKQVAASIPVPSHEAQLAAAGSTPALAPQPRVSPLGHGDDNAPRGLFIALATMVAGALTAAHVKVAQDRLAAIGL